MGIKCWLVFSALLSIVLGFSQQGSAYQLTSQDFQIVHQITQIIQQAEYGTPSSSHNQRFWEQYRALFNRQTSERKKRILFEVYYTGSYLAERKIGNFVEHTDLASLQILPDDYWKDKNHVYYIGYLQDGEVLDRRQEVFHILTGVDVQTFQVYDTKHQIQDVEKSYNYHHSIGFEGTEMFVYYAKDNQHVYIKGLPILWANPETYEVLPWGIFAKDDDPRSADGSGQIFFRPWYEPYAPNIPLQGVDVETFEVLSWKYAKDKQNVYEVFDCGGGSGRETCIERVKNADPTTFVVPPSALSQQQDIIAYDKNVGYRLGDDTTKIPNNIERLSDWSFYYADKKANKLYVRKDGLAATNLPYSWFQLLTGEGIIAGFGIYNHQLYFYGKLVPNVDLESLDLHVQFGENANTHIIKDKNTVYYSTWYDLHIITGADSKTFTGITYHYDYPDGTSSEVTLRNYYQDKNHMYRTDTPMPNVDKASFQALWTAYAYGKASYSRDKTQVYANANIITGADVKTFRIVWGIQRFDAMDKKGFYRGGEKIE